MAGTEDRLATGAPSGGRRRGMPRPNRNHPAVDQDQEREDENRTPVGADETPDDEFLAAFMDSLDQSVLPNLPPMPGFHVCWLTTSNPRDTIPNRVRMGYQLITTDMVGPGYEGASAKSGAYPGVLSVNEMLAARIPLHLYSRMMRHLHHDMPLGEEEKLRANIEAIRENAERHGAQIQEGDGMAQIVQRAELMPDQTE